MSGITFDWTISIGNLLTVAGFAISGLVFVMMMRSDVRILGSRVSAVEYALKDVAESALATAKNEGRIDAIDERVNMISARLDSLIFKKSTS